MQNIFSYNGITWETSKKKFWEITNMWKLKNKTKHILLNIP